MKKRTMKFLICAELFVLFALCFALGFAVAKFNIFANKGTVSIEMNTTQECNSTDVILTARCLNKELSSWWKYNDSNEYLFFNKLAGIEGSKVNWDVIKEQGGVCWHAAKWYHDYIKTKTIFDATYVFLKIGDGYHRYTVISSDKAYCTLDQMLIQCVNVDNGVKNESN